MYTNVSIIVNIVTGTLCTIEMIIPTLQYKLDGCLTILSTNFSNYELTSFQYRKNSISMHTETSSGDDRSRKRCRIVG